MSAKRSVIVQLLAVAIELRQEINLFQARAVRSKPALCIRKQRMLLYVLGQAAGQDRCEGLVDNGLERDGAVVGASGDVSTLMDGVYAAVAPLVGRYRNEVSTVASACRAWTGSV